MLTKYIFVLIDFYTNNSIVNERNIMIKMV